MTNYDALMIGFVVIGMLWGAWKGAVWQIATLASLGVGYAVAHPGSTKLAPYLAGDALQQRMEAMLVVYSGTSGGVFTGAWMIRSFLRKIKLQAYDRHVGMVLGGVTGAFLGMIVTLFVTTLAPQYRPTVFRSTTGKMEARGLWTLEQSLPPEASDMLAPFIDQMEADAIAKAAGEKSSSSLASKLGLESGATREIARKNTGEKPAFGQKTSQFFENIGRSLNNPPDSGDENADTRSR